MRKPCECGCGELARPGRRYVQYHNILAGGPHHPSWKGGVSIRPEGTGLCECGCGKPTKINRDGRRNRVLHGHKLPGFSGPSGPDNANWKGGRRLTGFGYIQVLTPDHPRADHSGYVFEHVLVASRALGRPVPKGSPVHHVNGDGSDNRPANLVVCESAAYHNLLHQRMRARDECGNPNWLKCKHCKRYDAPGNMSDYGGSNVRHPECHRRYLRAWKLRKKDAAHG